MGTSDTQQSDSKPKPRPDKTIDWLAESRDSWKEKTVTTKDELKKKKLAVKRARAARDEFKQQLLKKENLIQEVNKELIKKNQEIEILKRELETSQRKTDELKKKSFVR